MSCLQMLDMFQNETISDNTFTSTPTNKRPLIVEAESELLSTINPLDKTTTDKFASSTPLKKKRALFSETKENHVPSTSKPLLGDFKHTNNVNNNKPTTHISGQSFKDIIYNCYYSDYCKPYEKLNCSLLPECYDPETCMKKHKNIHRKEITTSSNGTFFSILDNPLHNWLYDISTAAFSILRPELYFSGDVMRILFDYILNGPDENLVWDVKHILASHLDLHPPCTEPMRQFYLTLLNQAYKEESYFKTDLTKKGILNYIINQLEEDHDLIKPLEEEQSEVSQENGVDTLDKFKEDLMQEITFEIMEQRWNNFEPILDKEYNELVDALDDLGKSTQEDEMVTVTNNKMPRFAIALELIIDILEADFLICVSKMKQSISLEETEWVVPLIKHFVDEQLQDAIFLLYVKTTHQDLWTQLSRLISVMAEFEHLFKPLPQELWHYPTLHSHCERFAASFCNSFNNYLGDWSEEERLMRLEILHPPWLRLKVAMHWVNSDLKLALGSDLKDLVDTIHMHVISPMKLEKDIHFKVNNIAVNNHSQEFIKKAIKKNKYGETLLHRICKGKKSSKSILFILLSSPEVDVNAKDNFGWTPLHEAVLAESVFITKSLLQYQPPPGSMPVDLGAQNSQGSTPLHEAVIANNLEICKLLVDYGGACLLRKTDCTGVTPLHLAKENADIKQFFDRVIKTQEMLNLSPDSVLNMPEFVVQLLVIACNAFLIDHHTWRVYKETKFNPTPKKLHQQKWIVVDQNTLIKFKKDQDEFRKLRKILNKLSENSKNASLVKLWNLKYISIV